MNIKKSAIFFLMLIALFFSSFLVEHNLITNKSSYQIDDSLYLEGLNRLCKSSAYLPQFAEMGFIPKWIENKYVNTPLAANACFNYIANDGQDKVAKDIAAQSILMLLATGQFGQYFNDNDYSNFNSFLEENANSSGPIAMSIFREIEHSFEYNDRIWTDEWNVIKSYPRFSFEYAKEHYLDNAFTNFDIFAAVQKIDDDLEKMGAKNGSLYLKMLENAPIWANGKVLTRNDVSEVIINESIDDDELYYLLIKQLESIGDDNNIYSYWAYRNAGLAAQKKKDYLSSSKFLSLAATKLIYHERILEYKAVPQNFPDHWSYPTYKREDKVDEILKIFEIILFNLSNDKISNSDIHRKIARNILSDSAIDYDEEMSDEQFRILMEMQIQIALLKSTSNYLRDAHAFCWTIDCDEELFERIIQEINLANGVNFYQKNEQLYQKLLNNPVVFEQLSNSDLLSLAQYLTYFDGDDQYWIFTEEILKTVLDSSGDPHAAYLIANNINNFDPAFSVASEDYRLMEYAANAGHIRAIEDMLWFWDERPIENWEDRYDDFLELAIIHESPSGLIALLNKYQEMSFLSDSELANDYPPAKDDVLLNNNEIKKNMDEIFEKLAKYASLYPEESHMINARLCDHHFTEFRIDMSESKMMNAIFACEFDNSRLADLHEFFLVNQDFGNPIDYLEIDFGLVWKNVLDCVAIEGYSRCWNYLANIHADNPKLYENHLLMGHLTGDFYSSKLLLNDLLLKNSSGSNSDRAKLIIADTDKSLKYEFDDIFEGETFMERRREFPTVGGNSSWEISSYSEMRSEWEKINYNFKRSLVFESLITEESGKRTNETFRSFFEATLSGNRNEIFNNAKNILERSLKDNRYEYLPVIYADRFSAIIEPINHSMSSKARIMHNELISQPVDSLIENDYLLLKNFQTNNIFSSALSGRGCSNINNLITEYFDTSQRTNIRQYIEDTQENQIENLIYILYSIGICKGDGSDELDLSRNLIKLYASELSFNALRMSEYFLIANELKDKINKKDADLFLELSVESIEKFRMQSLISETALNSNQELLLESIMDDYVESKISDNNLKIQDREAAAIFLRHFQLSSRPSIDKAINGQLLSFALDNLNDENQGLGRNDFNSLFIEKSNISLKLRDIELQQNASLSTIFQQNDLIYRSNEINKMIKPYLDEIYIPGYDFSYDSYETIISLQTALEDDELAVGLITTDKNLFRLEVTKNKISWHKESISKKELAKDVGRLEILANVNNVSNLEKRTNDFIEILKKLSPSLSPKNTENKKRIIYIVPTSLLSFPFHSLIDQSAEIENKYSAKEIIKNNGFISQNFGIKVAPSLTAILSTRDLYQPWDNQITPSFYKQFAKEDNRTKVLAIGNPKFNQEKTYFNDELLVNFRAPITNEIMDISMLPQLPETEDEAKEIVKLFDQSDYLVSSDANEENYLDLDKRAYKYISFATHALNVGELTNSDYSGLALTPSENNDGLLTAIEIASSPINAELVSLAACSTAAASKNDRDSLSGVVEGFIRAGAKNVLFTLWPVMSNPTKEINTKTFYYLKDGLKPDLALMNSLNDYLNTDHDDNHAYSPIVWSAYSIVGF